MFLENSIEISMLSRLRQITSPRWIHETSAQGWCPGETQRDGMEREVGGGISMGTHVNPWLIPVNVWQKQLQYCKVISLQLIKINGKKSILQGHSSKGIYVCHLSAMSHSLCWDLTTKTEFKQYATMRIKTQCPSYIHPATEEAPVVFKGQDWIDLTQE